MVRPRFSIVTVLGVIALAALALALAIARRELASARWNFEQVCLETGYIDVVDPQKVYVRQLYCPAPLTWQVQLYVPPEHHLQLGIGRRLQPPDNYPAELLIETNFFHSHPGQRTHTISLVQRPDAKGAADEWLLTHYPRSGTELWLDGDYAWIDPRRHSNSPASRAGEAPHGQVREYDVDERIPLLTLRGPAASPDAAAAPPNDLVIWLESDLKRQFDKRNGRPPGDAAESD
jgi:hypothetical protein